MVRLPYVVLAALLAIAAACPANATLVAYEGFDMGATPGALAGKAGATSIGFDVAGWAAHPTGTAGKYETTGLTFGSGATALTVSGGRALLETEAFGGPLDLDIMSRGLNVTVTGTVWGSYLGQRTVNDSFFFQQQDAMGVMVNQNPAGAASDNNSEFVIAADEFKNPASGSDLGGLRGKNTPIVNAFNSGVEITTNVPFMVLFKATNLGGTTGNADLASWILTSAQFDNFKLGGLTEAELTAAATGSAATQVLQKGTQSYDPIATARPYPRLTSADYFVLNAFRGIFGQFDELRLSDLNLDEVTPVPVPEAGSFLFVGLGSLGLLAAAKIRFLRA